MIKSLRNWAAVAALALLCVLPLLQAEAQTYPTNNPIYNPNAILVPSSLASAAAPAAFNVFTVQGVGEVSVRLYGTFTGLTSTIQGTTDQSGGSQNWFDLGPIPTAGSLPVKTITSAGTYRVNTAGLSQIRVNVTVLSTGTVSARMVGSPFGFFVAPGNSDLGALVTNTAQAAATVNSVDYFNPLAKGVTCTWNQASHAGTPSSTFKVQGKDSASATYYDILVSAAQTADTTPSNIVVYPSATVTSNVSANLHLPAVWRLSETVGGSGGPTVTGTIGCQTLN